MSAVCARRCQGPESNAQWPPRTASRRCAAVSFKSVVIGTSLLVSLSVIVADHTYAVASQHYDSGLYHLQSIIQITESPVVLGIANLHMRFGYNSLWFVDAAMLTIPGFGLSGAYLPNPLLMIFVVLATVQHVQMALKTPGCFRSALFGLAALLVFLNSYFLIKFSLGSPNTDVPSNLLIIYAAFLSLLHPASAPALPETPVPLQESPRPRPYLAAHR